MNDITYCYSNTDVLINKLDIQDAEILLKAEKRFTLLRILELRTAPIWGDFDFTHLCEIHRYIFQDLYDWAGKIRTVDIAKGNMFCKTEFLVSEGDKIFSRISKENFETLQTKEAVAKKLAYHFSEINALHPFREGNGRAQREFFRVLALKLGYELSFAPISMEEMIEASKASFLCDYSLMDTLFEKCITKI